jgi:hypothetical protein
MNNQTDKEKLARWMLRHSFATGHGDTIDDLLKELDWQIDELRSENRQLHNLLRSARKAAK